MDLLERYLQAVGQFLPATTREDTLAELRANLEEQIEARAEEVGRRLDENAISDVLRAHGRPEEVAARYLPQRSLIGPSLFPIYQLTLRKGVGYVALVYGIVRGLAMIATPGGGAPFAREIVGAVLGLFPTLLYFWGVLTMVFAAIEFAQSHYGVASRAKSWDPAKLPRVKRDSESAKQRSRGSRIAELVAHCLWMAYVLAVPWHPFLVLGPGAFYLQTLHLRFAPIWHVFYLLLIAGLLLQLVSKILALTPEGRSWGTPLKILKQLIDVGAVGTMAFAGELLFPGSAAVADAERIAGLNSVVGLAFRVALFFSVLALVIEAWKLVRRSVSTGGVVMGSPR